MKKLQNRITGINKSDGMGSTGIEEKISYAKLAAICINFVDPKVGINITDMKKRMKIINVLEKADESSATVIELEDADYDLMKKIVNDFQWAMMHKEIIEFINEINIS